MKALQVRKPFVDRKRLALAFQGPGRTKQSHKDECDINRIMAKFKVTGAIEHRNEYEGTYGEISDVDFTTAMQLITTAQQAFDDLPSNLRKKFGNDPTNYLEFVQDPENLEEMYDLGLATRPPRQANAPIQESAPEPPVATEEPSSGS